MHPVAQQLIQIRDELALKFFERKETIDFLILTLLAKQHGFILGPPGTGKSELIRELVSRIQQTIDNFYFETVLSKTRPDAAVLGPWNLPDLRDKGDFHRKIAGFLPSVVIAFLDEIGKMSPTAGHDFLSILNERLYHEVNGGRSAKKVPLHTCFTASNELIAAESDDAAALWDRLLMRTEVDYIQDASNFAQLLELGSSTTTNVGNTTVEWDALVDVCDNVIPNIKVQRSTIDAIMRLRKAMNEKGLVVSDRRWKQSIRVVQAQAFLSGRDYVIDDDIVVYRYTLWDTPDQIDPIARLCLQISNPEAEKLLEILDTAAEMSKGIDDRHGHAQEARASYGTEINKKLRLAANELRDMEQNALAAGRSTDKILETIEVLKTIKRKVFLECLDMDPDKVVNQEIKL